MPNVRVLKQTKLCSYVHAPVVLFCIVLYLDLQKMQSSWDTIEGWSCTKNLTFPFNRNKNN